MIFNILLTFGIGALVLRWYLRLKDERGTLNISRSLGNIALGVIEIPLVFLLVNLSILTYGVVSGSLFENPGTGLGGVFLVSFFLIIVAIVLGVLCLIILSALYVQRPWKLYDKLFAIIYMLPFVIFILNFI